MASGLTLKKFFFDRDVVLRAVAAKERAVMARQGGNVKRIAQTSMRYRKKPSMPGTAPSAHKDAKRGPLLRKFLFNAWDPTRRKQYIGPQGLGGSKVPKLMEEGGTTVVTTIVPRAKGKALSPAAKAAFLRKVAAGQVVNARPERRYKIARYPARPFMSPALRASLTKYPRLWAGSLRAA